MIDNIALLITGTLHERDIRELLERCHPLGWFETMPVLCVASNIEVRPRDPNLAQTEKSEFGNLIGTIQHCIGRNTAFFPLRLFIPFHTFV